MELGEEATSLTLGSDHSCAILASGRVKCWGYNERGQLGLGDTENRGDGCEPASLDDGGIADGATDGSADVENCLDVHEMGNALPAVGSFGTSESPVVALGAGYNHTCALLANREVWCWGNNGSGQLGRGDAGPPVLAPAGPVLAPGESLGALHTEQLCSGGNHNCSVVDGRVYCWGGNALQQLGVDDADPRTRPDQPVRLVDDVVEIGCGISHTCAVVDDGATAQQRLWCWGDNREGQLGAAAAAAAFGPVEVDLGTGYNNITGIALGRDHSCALLDDSRIKCWGGNWWGQLGLGDREARGDSCLGINNPPDIDAGPDSGLVCGVEVEEMGDNLPFVDLDVCNAAGAPELSRCGVVAGPAGGAGDLAYDICVTPTRSSLEDPILPKVCVSPGTCVPDDLSCNAPGPAFPLPDTGQRACYSAPPPAVDGGVVDADVDAGVGDAAGEDASLVIDCVAEPDCSPEGADHSDYPLYCGQDAQYGWDTEYDYELERFTRIAPGPTGNEYVVQDGVTGLEWLGCTAPRAGLGCYLIPPKEYLHSEALTYCSDLVWGGYRDWRLPNPQELFSIVRHGGTAPYAYDVFPNTQDSYWTSSQFTNGGGFGYAMVSFSDQSMQRRGDSARSVLCVRGDPVASPERFERETVMVEDGVANGSWQVVRDHWTGLEWFQCLSTTTSCGNQGVSYYSWPAALSLCERNYWAGRFDWRLPSIVELTSLLDHRYPAFLDPAFMDGNAADQGHGAWSATTWLPDPDMALAVHRGGILTAGPKEQLSCLRCVRSFVE